MGYPGWPSGRLRYVWSLASCSRIYKPHIKTYYPSLGINNKKATSQRGTSYVFPVPISENKLKIGLRISSLPAVGLGSHRTGSTDWPNSPRFVLQDNCECQLIFYLKHYPVLQWWASNSLADSGLRQSVISRAQEQDLPWSVYCSMSIC